MNHSLSVVPSISVVVPTYRRGELVKKCLKSLLEQDYPRDHYEVIVVEDGSHEAQSAVESLKSDGTRLVYLNLAHSGAAAAYGAGLTHARCDLVAFIDDDAIAPPDWLSHLATTLTEGKARGIVGTGGHISGEYPE